MNVDKYFEIYTGGNDFIKTWTPTALKDFAEDYYKMKNREKEKILIEHFSPEIISKLKDLGILN